MQAARIYRTDRPLARNYATCRPLTRNYGSKYFTFWECGEKFKKLLSEVNFYVSAQTHRNYETSRPLARNYGTGMEWLEIMGQVGTD